MSTSQDPCLPLGGGWSIIPGPKLGEDRAPHGPLHNKNSLSPFQTRVLPRSG